MGVIRGAINLKENSVEEIERATFLLFDTIKERYNLKEEDIIMFIISATNDITKKYPCAVIRKSGFENLPLLCVQEMYVENSMPLVIRFLIQCKDNVDSGFVYLGETDKLRKL